MNLQALTNELKKITRQIDRLSAEYYCGCESGDCEICGCLVRLANDVDQLGTNCISRMNAGCDRIDEKVAG